MREKKYIMYACIVLLVLHILKDYCSTFTYPSVRQCKGVTSHIFSYYWWFRAWKAFIFCDHLSLEIDAHHSEVTWWSSYNHMMIVVSSFGSHHHNKCRIYIGVGLVACTACTACIACCACITCITFLALAFPKTQNTEHLILNLDRLVRRRNNGLTTVSFQ